MKLFLQLITTTLFLSTVTFAQNKLDSILVIPIKMQLPENAKKIGSIKVGNNSTAAHCDYEAVLQNAKMEAMALGGNLIKITHLIPPVFISKCYKIKADVYYSKSLDSFIAKREAKKNEKIEPINSSTAILYLYRLKDTIAFGIGYSIHLNNDSVIAQVRSKSFDSVLLYTPGLNKIWAKTENKVTLNINTKPGEKYYVRCGLIKGEIRMLPVLELVDEKTGAMQLSQLKGLKKDMDIRYLNQIH